MTAVSTTPMDPERGRIVVTSVLRALRLLELFDRGRPEMSLAEFVRRSGYSKTTTCVSRSCGARLVLDL